MTKRAWLRLVLGLLLIGGVAASAEAYGAGDFVDCEIMCGEPGSGCILFANNCSSCSTSGSGNSCSIEFEGCTGGTGCVCAGSGWNCTMYYYD
jgi:hypothetical protein